MCTHLQIRNLSTMSREAPIKSSLKIGILVLMWTISLLAPVCSGIGLLYVKATDRAGRVAALLPAKIQMGVLFLATAILTGSTQIKMIRHFAASQASHDQNHLRTYALVEKAMRTAAVQFLSATGLQVLIMYSL